MAADSFTPDTLGMISGAVQLAIAPIFLLVATGSFLNVMTSRLARVVDRARALEAALDTHAGDLTAEDRSRAELQILDKRMRSANRAIAWISFASVVVSAMVALLFLQELFSWPVAAVIAVLFVVTMGSLIISLSYFLHEISIATATLRVRSEFLCLPPSLNAKRKGTTKGTGKGTGKGAG